MTDKGLVDKKFLTDTIRDMLSAGLKLLKKDSFSSSDFAKLKVMKSMSTSVNASVSLVQQEQAAKRIQLIALRMKQLGYEPPKGIETTV